MGRARILVVVTVLASVLVACAGPEQVGSEGRKTLSPVPPINSDGSPLIGEGVFFLDESEARFITEDYSGRTLTYEVAESFGFMLDDERFPVGELVYSGCPIQHWKSQSVNGPDRYPIAFSASSRGACEVLNGRFRVRLKIVDGDEARG